MGCLVSWRHVSPRHTRTRGRKRQLRHDVERTSSFTLLPSDVDDERKTRSNETPKATHSSSNELLLLPQHDERNSLSPRTNHHEPTTNNLPPTTTNPQPSSFPHTPIFIHRGPAYFLCPFSLPRSQPRPHFVASVPPQEGDSGCVGFTSAGFVASVPPHEGDSGCVGFTSAG